MRTAFLLGALLVVSCMIGCERRIEEARTPQPIPTPIAPAVAPALHAA
jgi:hypothetical protein